MFSCYTYNTKNQLDETYFIFQAKFNVTGCGYSALPVIFQYAMDNPIVRCVCLCFIFLLPHF